jgi:hypothetical protein
MAWVDTDGAGTNARELVVGGRTGLPPPKGVVNCRHSSVRTGARLVTKLQAVPCQAKSDLACFKQVFYEPIWEMSRIGK